MKWEVPVTGREEGIIWFDGTFIFTLFYFIRREQVLVGISEEKETTRKTNEQLKENINIDIQQIG